MFKALLGKQMAELLNFFIGKSKNGKPRSAGQKFGMVLLLIFVFASMFFLFFSMALGVCVTLVEAELDWVYFALMGGIGLMLGVVGSVFSAYNGIFVAKDNELLLSMPIKSHMIVFVRMLSLYIISFVFDALVLIPVGVVYFIFGNPTLSMILLYPLTVILHPAISLTISCLLGWLIALIVPHVKNKNLITMIVSVVFMGAYFIVCFNASNYMEAFIANVDKIADAIASVYPLYIVGRAMMGEILPFLGFAAFCLAVFGLVYYVISKTFMKLSIINRGSAKIKYEAREMSVASLDKALFKKEMSRFFSSATYVLNCGMGVIMLVLLVVFAVFKSGDLRTMVDMLASELPEMKHMVSVCIGMLITFIMSTVIISAPSVSLEGKSLWIAQSLPVRGYKVLKSKLMVHIAIALPAAVLGALMLSIIVQVSVLDTVVLMLYTASHSIICAFVGLIMNLLLPRFDWTNETVAVKQSGSVGFTMLIMFGIEIIHCIAMFVLSVVLPGWIPLLAFAIVDFIAIAVMWNYLKNGGERRFEKL